MSPDPSTYELSIGPDRTIRGSIHLPPESAWPAPALIFCHGFKGFKDWGPWPWFASALADRGFVVNRFNFSLNGVGVALDRHDEPEKFARNTYGHEIEDLAAVLERREEWRLPPGVLGSRCGVVGHSRGGLIALLAGGEIGGIDSIVTLASPGRSRRHTDEQVEIWRERGFLEVPNARTGEVMRIDLCVLEDYFEQEDRYDLASQIARRRIPTLVIHGDADESVPVEEASWILDAIPHEDKERVILRGAGHTFGAGHPFDEPTASLEAILERTDGWMRHTLGETR